MLFENVQQPISKSISTKLDEQEYNRINELIADDLFLNSADFVKKAIREKFKTYDEVVSLRENAIYANETRNY